jgi:hypothetical protein
MLSNLAKQHVKSRDNIFLANQHKFLPKCSLGCGKSDIDPNRP